MVVKVLQELEPGIYEHYLLKDGSVIVKMKRISFNQKRTSNYQACVS